MRPRRRAVSAGERDMLKVKRLRTADCVSAGFVMRQIQSSSARLLGLYDDQGKLDHVGFTSAITDADRHALTRKLEPLTSHQASLAMPLAARADGATRGLPSGSLCATNWWSRSAMTTSPEIAPATAPR